eukprot:TRINITY_DN18765_c0_g1_i2.p1 TRINITY_DN18765_c0_g1~~TRINITY_DN18765_c0_g1_i2.p1  ORF type:complete len:700 (+),score=134.94 TRINITY_DN18765_c0_g1_i2:28-2100(+)
METSSAFSGVVCSPSTFSLASKAEDGVWIVPKHGKVSFLFSIQRLFDVGIREIHDEFNFTEVLEKLEMRTRSRLSFSKVVPGLAVWKMLEGSHQEQKIFLQALAKDFILTVDELIQLCRSQTRICDVLGRLLHCVVGGSSSVFITLQFAASASIDEYMATRRCMDKYCMVNFEHPTGHYKLDLSNCAEFGIAQKLLLLDRWETGIAKRQERLVTSQNGLNTQVRNGRYASANLPVANIQEWMLPSVDILELDYVGGKRPSADSKPLPTSTFESVKARLYTSPLGIDARTEVLRMVAHLFCVSAKQLREFVGFCAHARERAELFVLMFFRLADVANEKVVRVRFEESVELHALMDRLGHVTLFPFIQPEQSMFHFDLSRFDQRLAAHLIVRLASKEDDGNLRNYGYVNANGTVDSLTLGVPRSWGEDVKSVPQGGSFRVTYQCAPEKRNFAFRQMLLKTYGLWPWSPPEEDVLWWASTTEAPPDVIEFLEFLVSRFDLIDEVFDVFDKATMGNTGNGQITLRKFEECFRTLGCNKFKTHDEKSRIIGIFRYLDKGGEGEISRHEWSALDALWTELQTTIRDFVSFLEMKFGESNDFLATAWRELDVDGDGELVAEEWSSITRLRFGYFGPTMVIFHFLDKDDEGFVSMDGFRALEKFQVSGWTRLLSLKRLVTLKRCTSKWIGKLRRDKSE